MIKKIFQKYIDKKKLYTDLFRIILVALFLYFWKNIEIVINYFNSTIFKWIGIVLTYEISLPIVPLILLIAFILFSSYLINKFLLNNRIRKGKTFQNKFDNWIVTTNKNTPQWTAYKELPLNSKLFEKVELELLLKTEYLRFGIKLLDKNGRIFGTGRILHNDNNLLVHIGKGINDNSIHYIAYKNGVMDINPSFAIDYNKGTILKIALLIDKNNQLKFFLNNQVIYDTVINPILREKICLMAWGDGNEYEMDINNISYDTIE